jgi:hypothetical protein
MKTIVKIVAFCLTVSAYAQQPTPTKETAEYCADLKDGVVVLTEQELPVEGDILLLDSSVVSKNGTLIRKNGMKQSLQSGECVNQDGNIHMGPMTPKQEGEEKKKKKKG